MQLEDPLASSKLAASHERGGRTRLIGGVGAMVLGRDSVVGGRYLLDRQLDRGGMGAVWVARDVAGGAPVAVKLLSHSLAHRQVCRRFRRETEALRRLDAPNVVRILDHGVAGDVPFIAMELLEGESLRALLERRGALPLHDALEIVSQSAEGLRAAHRLGIVHRDVKPSNLFMVRSKRGAISVKVIDFGIATGELFEQDSHGSSTGFIGSPAFMSPEQARGEDVTTLADVWSLAVVAFQALTAGEPFAGANVPETLQNICSGEAPLPSQIALNLPAALDTVFAQAFARSPRDRYPSVDAFVAALRAALEGTENRTAVRAAPPWVRRGRRSETISYEPAKKPAPGVKPNSSRLARALAAASIASAVVLVGRLSPSSDPAQTAPVFADAPSAARERAAAPAEAVSVLPIERAEQVVLTESEAPRELQPARRPARRRAEVASPQAPVRAAPMTPKPERAQLDPIFGLPIAAPNAHETSSQPAPDRDAALSTDLDAR